MPSTQRSPGYASTPVNPHGEPIIDELNSLLEVLHEHDDRALVLTLAAFAEDTLKKLLIGYMREEKQAKELVEGFNAPLGTFAARSKAALVMGLIHREQYDDLEVLRRIRNAFAHDWQGVSFDRNDIKALIGQLHAYTLDHTEIGGDGRDKLRGTLTTILIELRVLHKQLKRKAVRTPSLSFRLATQKPIRVDFVEVDELPLPPSPPDF